MRQTTLIIHHSPCADGFCAAWAAHRSLRNRPGQDVEFYPTNYGDPPVQDVTNKLVFMLDFSYPLEEMQRIQRDARALIVLDHHKTAQKALEALEPVNAKDHFQFDMDKSGARLTWEYFFGSNTQQNAHWLVDFTEDRDLWRHRLARTREINAAIRSYPQTFEAWDELGKKHPDVVFTEGEAIRRREQQIIDYHVKRATEMIIGDHVIPVVNSSVFDLTSDIANELAKGQPCAGAWFLDADGKYRWSLRSTEDGVDVSKIAERFGGGGHTHASGFESDMLDPEEALARRPPSTHQDPVSAEPVKESSTKRF